MLIQTGTECFVQVEIKSKNALHFGPSFKLVTQNGKLEYAIYSEHPKNHLEWSTFRMIADLICNFSNNVHSYRCDGARTQNEWVNGEDESNTHNKRWLESDCDNDNDECGSCPKNQYARDVDICWTVSRALVLQMKWVRQLFNLHNLL